MKPYKRTDRIAKLIQHELATVLLQKRAESFAKEITITQVIVAPDLVWAKVFFTYLHSGQTTITPEGITTALNNEHAFFQHQIACHLRLRKTPKLEFIYDELPEQSRRLDDLITKAPIEE